MTHSTIYTIGGTVQAGSGYYVERQADGELLDLCQQGEFTCILASRQVGKSSLIIRTANELKKQDLAMPVIIDLQEIGTSSEEEWYLGFLLRLAERLHLKTDLFEWWEKNELLGITDRFTRFFSQVLLPQMTKKIVIFIDEIDTTLALNYTDDFFIAIRYFYNERANNSEFKRLSFVLVGVATPGELIKDRRRTPFNIGHNVELTDFTSEEAHLLALGLALGEKTDEVFRLLLEWTGGHPYLTQRLCVLVRDRLKDNFESGKSLIGDQIKVLVEEEFFGEKSYHDIHLQWIEDMFKKRFRNSFAIFQVYRQILRGDDVVDQEQSEVKAYLKIIGVVKRQGKNLIVRNKIYQKFFDETWIKSLENPYDERIQLWDLSKQLDQSKLLLFDDYKDGDRWYRQTGSKMDLTEVEAAFFEASREFNQFLEECLAYQINNESKQIIVRRVVDWTNGNSILNTKIFEVIKKFPKSIQTEVLEQWVDDLIAKNLRESPSCIFKDVFSDISKKLLLFEDIAIDSFQLLLTYSDILDENSYDCNLPDSPDPYKDILQEINLVIKSGDRLKVANKIYAEMFNRTWIEQHLKSPFLRPYGKQFVKWLSSKGKDRNSLLRGKMLKEAEMRFENDRIHKKERQFLLDSRFFQ